MAVDTLLVKFAEPQAIDMKDVEEMARVLQKFASLQPRHLSVALMGMCAAGLADDEWNELDATALLIAAGMVYKYGKGERENGPTGAVTTLVNLSYPFAASGLVATMRATRIDPDSPDARLSDADRIELVKGRRRYALRLFDFVNDVKRLNSGLLGPLASPVEDAILEWVEETEEEVVRLGGAPIVPYADLADAMLWGGEDHDYFEPKTGRVIRLDADGGTEPQPDWVLIPKMEPTEGIQDRRDFVAFQPEPLASTLATALSSGHPFRRFREELDQALEAKARWYSFLDSRMRQRVQDWVGAEGLPIELVDR